MTKRVWNWRPENSSLDVPPWASFFEPLEYREFINAVAADLHRRGDVVEIEQGVARLVLGENNEHTFGLQNLAQMCNQTESESWPEIIKGHFDGVIRSSAGVDLESLAEDWDHTKTLVKVRLYSEDAVADTLGGLCYRDVADGLLAVLTYDLPEAVATVPRTDLERWPIDADEAFAMGLANVLDQDPVHAEEIELDSGARFTALIGDSFFVTTRLLAADELLEDMGEFGAVIAVPNRHTLLISPVMDLRVVEVLNAMMVVAHHRHAEGPGSLSPDLFWCRTGKETVTMHASVEDGALAFEPPAEFVDTCLRHLPPPRGGYGPN